MASATSRIAFRIVLVSVLVLVLFYIGRPLYWKISATVHDIRNNKQTVRQGLSQIVMEAQKSVGWYHDVSDSGVRAATRKLLHNNHNRLVVHSLVGGGSWKMNINPIKYGESMSNRPMITRNFRELFGVTSDMWLSGFATV